MEQGEEKVSKYNSGINIIMRLDSLWRETHSAVKLEKYYLWNTLLDRIWCELARDLPEDDFEDKELKDGTKITGYKTKFEALDKEIADSGELVDDVDKLTNGFEKITPSMRTNRSKQYKALMKKDLFLRRLENHLGKGTAWDEDVDGFD